MPPPKRKPATVQFLTHFGDVAGPSLGDFYALAYSSEYDEANEHLNPPTFMSPTSRFTHVFRYVKGARSEVHLVNDRLLTLWQSPSGETLAAGFPRGVYDVSTSGVTGTMFKNHFGVFTGLHGPSSDYVYACGMIPPFLLAREHGKWQPKTLPAGTVEVLHDVFAFSALDVYVAGAAGTLLHHDGSAFEVLEVPTTRALRCLAPLGRRLCIGGEDGVLLYGDRQGWRQIPTGTDGILEKLGAYQGHVFFGTDDGVWRFDGQSSPTLELDQPAQGVWGFSDGLVIAHGSDAFTWDGTTLTPLDTLL